jgi:hypothetical protein
MQQVRVCGVQTQPALLLGWRHSGEDVRDHDGGDDGEIGDGCEQRGGEDAVPENRGSLGCERHDVVCGERWQERSRVYKGPVVTSSTQPAVCVAVFINKISVDAVRDSVKKWIAFVGASNVRAMSTTSSIGKGNFESEHQVHLGGMRATPLPLESRRYQHTTGSFVSSIPPHRSQIQ